MRGENIRAAREARGWSVRDLIQAMGTAAKSDGINLMTFNSLKVALSRWENNRTHPDQMHTRLLAKVLDLPDPADVLDRAREYPPDSTAAVTLLDSLASSDLDDDSVLASGDERNMSSSDASQIVTGYLFAHSPGIIIATGDSLQGVAAAERIRSTASSMMSMDFEHGGGHVRQRLLEFFRQYVVPQLRAAHPEPVRREIFSAAAEVAQILGWSAYDAGRHRPAVRYWIQGLKLAEEGRDHLLGARLLANLSHQANFLGRYSDAVMYARAAQSALSGRATPMVETMCVMMEARGLANLADPRGTAAVIHRAEQIFARRSSSEPTWISYYDPAELAGDASHCFRDLGLAPNTREFVTQALTDNTPPRTKAFIQVVSGEAALIAGDLEEAGSLAAAAIINGDGLESARYLRYLQDFRNRLPAGAATHPDLAEFVDLLHTHHPAIAALPAA